MRTLFRTVGFLGAFLLFEPAFAVVNQVDGQVVPIEEATTCPGDTDNCIQTGLNYGEGVNPPSTGPDSPDAVLDANTGPETFLIPTDSSGDFNSVTFSLLQEGAGYENIFGWYNVGSPTKRYPVILSCAFNKKSTYEPPAYNTASPPVLTGGYKATIDFQAEYAAGRYAGGQIGFYLVTPEGSTNASASGYAKNCATDPNDQGTLASGGAIDDDYSGSATDDTAGYGRVYYTESQLNNDGNYVHYLIYQSKVSSKTFYFGFEDLFRGGDNDYDDTFVQVVGLVPTCQAAQETCNGKDDNCNGKIDENLTKSCYTGKTGTSGVGICADGTSTCTKGTWGSCSGEVTPTTETCNSKDDDCDGTVDNNLGSLGSCTVAGCKGSYKCVSGKLVCDAPTPTVESCNGKDDDCDGSIDENLTRPCSNDCGTGTETCSFSDDSDTTNDWVNCTAPTPSKEVCNGIDDDCNGIVDDNIVHEGLPCDHASGKTCQQGKTKCVGGKITCVGATTGSKEICDCKDNDCDGLVDEGDTCPTGSTCINCACRIKCSGQEFGCPKGYTCKNGYCIEDECADITCKSGETCKSGQCVSKCEGVSCASGKVCADGACVENNCYGKGCASGQVCYGGQCIAHPCTGVSCSEGEFCENGACKPSCGPVTCGESGLCRYGRCVGSECTGSSCSSGIPCVDGKCDQACDGVSCSTGSLDKRTCKDGECVDDPCALVTCFGEGEWCEEGQCVTVNTSLGRESDLLATGGVSCAVTDGTTSAALALPFLLLLATLLLVAARRREP
jgi:Notch 1